MLPVVVNSKGCQVFVSRISDFEPRKRQYSVIYFKYYGPNERNCVSLGFILEIRTAHTIK
jgi:hypothetical protein